MYPHLVLRSRETKVGGQWQSIRPNFMGEPQLPGVPWLIREVGAE
jgi:hypothetical protein